MIRLHNDFDLSRYNTFGIKAKAATFFEFTESEELITFLSRHPLPEDYLVMGGGSNLLFAGDYGGLIIHPNIPGLLEEDEDRNYVYLEAGAGVEWDELVRLSVSYQLGGLENLSLIPGKVGAAPVQNIGAYGVEVGERIVKVRGISLESGERVEFSNEACHFAYRNSVFKQELRNKVVITSVVFKLDKFPDFHLEYGALKDEVNRLGEASLEKVRDAVISIRNSKLPDPALTGNAGSFFKNPELDESFALQLQKQYPAMPVYATVNASVMKVAAGWLIEQCGWKGFRKGDAGVHPKQALVLVNYGSATGEEIIDLAEKIQRSVYKQFGICLSPEVNLIGMDIGKSITSDHGL